MTRRLMLGAVMLLLGQAALADTLGEQKRLIINPINETDFETIELPGFGAQEHWCAAASYHERRRGRPATDRLYVKSPRGPSVTQPGRRGVIFTTDPERVPGGPVDQLGVTVKLAGANMKSVNAYRFCRDAFTRSTK